MFLPDDSLYIVCIDSIAIIDGSLISHRDCHLLDRLLDAGRNRVELLLIDICIDHIGHLTLRQHIE